MIRTFTQYAKHRLSTYTLRTLREGFTLAEMLTICAIITIITAVVVQNQSQFTSDLELTNIAYRIAVEARQAQVYGIGVRQAEDGVDSFNSSYGLHFVANQQDNIIFFKDVDGNKKYTGPSGDDTLCGGVECIEQLNLGKGNKLGGYCALRFDANGEVFCSSRSFFPIEFPDLPLYALDILFKRPKPDAIFNFYEADYSQNPTSSRCDTRTSCDGVAICLESPQGKKKRVVILATGQISVENVGETAAAGGNLCL